MAYIAVEGLKEFQRALRKAADDDLPKRLGQANKSIGELVIAKLTPAPDPRAIGAGSGAKVRSSASKREVLLRVGGTHRSSGAFTKMQPWGKRRVQRVGVQAPARPFIQGTAQAHRDEIYDAWLTATLAALAPAFDSSDKT